MFFKMSGVNNFVDIRLMKRIIGVGKVLVVFFFVLFIR